MSCPYAVVPSQWCADGVRLNSYARWLGCATLVNHHGNSAMTVNDNSSTLPATALPLCRTALSTPAPVRARDARPAVGSSNTGAWLVRAAVTSASALRSGARVEQEGADIAD